MHIFILIFKRFSISGHKLNITKFAGSAFKYDRANRTSTTHSGAG